MQTRIVEIESEGVHLAAERGFLRLSRRGVAVGSVPLDDISAVVVHGHATTFSATLCSRLAERNTPLIICDQNHAPSAILWAVRGNHEQGKRMQAQAAATLPRLKSLWRDIVVAKIRAQADVLGIAGAPLPGLRLIASRVRSGDPENLEARAARMYWPALMGTEFRRDRHASGPNALLNYGYAILRAGAARAIMTAGLHPSLSIHHQSRGDATRLADDLMEPFRPVLDLMVWRLIHAGKLELVPEVKRQLAQVLMQDLESESGVTPVQLALNDLALSLTQVFMKERRKLRFPGQPRIEIDLEA